MADWKAGDKALCVDARGWQGGKVLSGLFDGEIYTVHDIVPADDSAINVDGITDGGIDLLLMEVHNRHTPSGGFGAYRFVKPPSETHFKHILSTASRESEVA